MRGGLYVGNREPLLPSPLMQLPIGSITPRGWLRHQLELERDGMTGHLEEISPWLNFKTKRLGEQGRQRPARLGGIAILAQRLTAISATCSRMRPIIAEARKWIDAAFVPARGRLVRSARLC